MLLRELFTQLDEAATPKKLSKRVEYPGQGVVKLRDKGGYDRIYYLNRIMMAAGMSDGSGKAITDIDAGSWVEKFNSGHPFTEEEFKMLQAAMKTIPTEGSVVSKWEKSKELPSTNTASPVAKPKRNKYGI